MVCCPQQILVQLVHGDLVSWCNSWNQIWGAKIVEINNSFHLHQLHKPLVLLTATLHSDGRGRMWWWQNQVRLVQTWCIWYHLVLWSLFQMLHKIIITVSLPQLNWTPKKTDQIHSHYIQNSPSCVQDLSQEARLKGWRDEGLISGCWTVQRFFTVIQRDSASCSGFVCRVQNV